MPGSTLAVIIIPAVIAVLLAGWLVAVFHADRHPEPGDRSRPPDREVTGGIFRSVGGRQQMPRPDATPAAARDLHRGIRRAALDEQSGQADS